MIHKEGNRIIVNWRKGSWEREGNGRCPNLIHPFLEGAVTMQLGSLFSIANAPMVWDFAVFYKGGFLSRYEWEEVKMLRLSSR